MKLRIELSKPFTVVYGAQQRLTALRSFSFCSFLLTGSKPNLLSNCS